jgi:trimethylamine---corrinoid protein Co-methyltransferase
MRNILTHGVSLFGFSHQQTCLEILDTHRDRKEKIHMEANCNSGGLYKPLTDGQVKTIHRAALAILKDTGLSYESDQKELIGRLKSAGATIDEKTKCIKFGENLLTEALSSAPEKVVLYSRNGEHDLKLFDDRVYFGTGGTTTTILDIKTGENRPSMLNDIYQIARLTDQLKNIDTFIRPCTPMDTLVDDYDVNIVYAGLKGTQKHFMMGIFDENKFENVIDIAAMVAGGLKQLQEKPFISFYTSFSISPLQQTYTPTKILIDAVEKRLPISISGVPMAGSTGPITIAGNLTLMHAEVVAGIAISQLICPGAPVLYGGFGARADMQTAGFLVGAIECGMMNAAVHQLAKYIKVPNCSSCGLSESKLPDSQASWESAMLILTAAMGGSNLIRHAGGGVLESGMSLSLEQIVMNDEMIGMARRLLSGIVVDNEHIGLDLIKEIGPGGTFLTADHTIKHMRTEYFYGNGVTNRSQRERWLNDGAKNAVTRAKEIAERILSIPDSQFIPENVDQAIRKKYPISL